MCEVFPTLKDDFLHLGLIPSTKKSAAVFFCPGMCAIVKLTNRKESHAFQICGGISLVGTNRVTHLLAVIKMTGFDVLQKICHHSSNAKYVSEVCVA